MYHRLSSFITAVFWKLHKVFLINGMIDSWRVNTVNITEFHFELIDDWMTAISCSRKICRCVSAIMYKSLSS